ncbi:hypothetical protein EVJ58_g8957 [Rhodofomes roseus]|uniref:Fungal-type protein kinase domain-containing protein n=1 Tax=Rhodofomes roseus TaxID=34475 RepID=A0A4Y9XYQ4_9APHY|nr:hypothetical protein EVJ58_g8957 [Rhodofomes roseus]
MFSLSEDRRGTSPPVTSTQPSVPPSPTSTVTADLSTELTEISALSSTVGASAESSTGPSHQAAATRETTPTGTIPPTDTHGTPVRGQVSNLATNSVSAATGRDKDVTRFAKEMWSKMTEMDFNEFMKEYMPGPDLPSESTLKIPDFDKDKLMALENTVCVEICRVAQAIFDGCPNKEKLVARNTRDHADSSDHHDYAEQLRVDVSVYPTHRDARADYASADDDSEKKEFRASTRWAWISLLVEIKTALDKCAFTFDNKGGYNLKKSDKAKGETNREDGNGSGGVSAQNQSHDDPVKSAAGNKGKGKGRGRDSGSVRARGRGGGNGRSKGKGTAKGMGKGKVADVDDDAEDPTKQPEQDENSGKTDTKGKARPFIRSGTGANDSLGQMAEYVSKLFRRQHRLHLFTLFIFKGQARVIRWDRAGAIISTPIDFEKDPSLLHQVLWRYACMNEVERGFDPTVVRATVEEIEAMRTCPAPNGWADKCRQDALGQPGWPVYKIMMRPDDLINQQGIQPLTKFMKPDPVDSIAPGGEVSYIIGKRYFATNSPSGRGTRGYIAYDVSRNRLVFLKDYWRSRLDSSIPEGEALKRLRASGVRNVPTPLAAGVVRDDAGVTQKTCTQEWLKRDERTKCYSPIQEHYRLVVKEIGEPLTEEVKSVWELVKVICDALYAHRQAWEVEKILHRDISSMNILVYRYIDHKGQPRVVGLLIDWDLCKLMEYLGIASRPARSGTWQFMSARLLQRPGKKHEVADDIESFIHVFNWTCLRFVEHNLTGKPRLLQMHVVHMYEEQDIMVDGEKNEEEVGGEAKGIQMLSGRPAVKLTKPRTPLGKLLKELASICRQHYLAVEPESELVSQAVPLDSGPDEDESLDEMELFEDPLESDSEEERPETPSDTASETLSKHKKVYNAFRRALDKPKVEWNSVAATPDQFNDPVFKNSIVFQRRTERSSQRSSGSKRRLDGESADMTKLGPSKRMRSATVTGLESLEEEGFVAPHDEAQEQ